MSKAKFKRRGKASQLPAGGLIALCCGHDFFGGFSDGNPTLTQETLDKMREAWQDPAVRQLVEDRQRQRHKTPTSFARLAFGPTGRKRATVDEVDDLRAKYMEQSTAITAKL